MHIPAIEQLLGTDTNTTIALYDSYLLNGLDAHAGVFAEIVKDTAAGLVADPMPVTFTADKAGGIATPNLNLTNLSRAHGPLAARPPAPRRMRSTPTISSAASPAISSQNCSAPSS